MFSKEDYDDWKIRMQAHLAAQDDDMWSVITDGPIKIMKANTAIAISAGAPEWVEKRRYEYTTEEKRNRIWTAEGSTRRFDDYSPSANTQSPSLAPGELLATTNKKQTQLLFTNNDIFRTASQSQFVTDSIEYDSEIQMI
ncbi:hypothetical protein F511_23890 [Dorcoceras hygrometricum]|uniref:Uncharacterized protein n=1 Tax=Dorcoceras hygrometricum TaxID=472368 RepID=A0A2Z7CNG9_9LAMI|nr:hypothetical protein F511_23890 [Dorcoceras hygrometricum]